MEVCSINVGKGKRSHISDPPSEALQKRANEIKVRRNKEINERKTEINEIRKKQKKKTKEKNQ